MKTRHHRLTTAVPAALAAALALSCASASPVGWRDVTAPRPDGSAFEARVYYPAEAEGADALPASASSPYPAVSFGHGLLSPPVLYGVTTRLLASHGYVVIATKSGLEFPPDLTAYIEDLSLCLDYLDAANRDPASFLAGMVDTEALGMAGHSMGGGSALWAAAADPRVKAVVAFAPARFGPPSDEMVASLKIPVCIVAGAQDGITPMLRHALPLSAAANPPFVLAVIQGGFHCAFSDFPVPDPFCDEGDIDPERQREISRALLTDFMGLYLGGRDKAWSRVWGPDALFTPDVTLLQRPGVALRPRLRTRRAWPGVPVTVALTLAHEAGDPARYSLGYAGTAANVDIDPPETGLLAAGDTARIEVTLTRPVGATHPCYAVISARSDADGITGAYAVIVLAP